MDNLVQQFFEAMRTWISKILPQETKNCLRTTLGKIISGSGKTVTIRLVGSPEDGSEDLTDIKIAGTYNRNDTVIVAYTDNNLTNAFVLFNLTTR